MAKAPPPPKMPTAAKAKSAKAIGKQPNFGKANPFSAPPAAKGGNAKALRKARLAGKPL